MSVTTETPAPVARIQPDSPTLVRGVVTATVLLAAAAWVAGVPGLLAVAGWAELDGPLRWTVPVLLDGGLLIMGAVATVQRARHEPARFAWAVLGLLTAGSVAAQVAHVVATSDRSPWQVYAGAGLAATFPLLVFASTHVMLAVAVAPAPTRRARATAAARRPAPAAVTSPVLDAAPPPPTPTAAAPRTPTPTAPLPARPAPARATTTTAGVEAREQAVRLASEGMSQRQIADAVGASKSSVARWLVSEAITV